MLGDLVWTAETGQAATAVAALVADVRAARRMDEEIALAREDGWSQRAIGDARLAGDLAAVVRRLDAGDRPDLDAGLWVRVSLVVVSGAEVLDEMTPGEVAALRHARREAGGRSAR
jgi:hypothetical protein